jgi:hypothetical protein
LGRPVNLALFRSASLNTLGFADVCWLLFSLQMCLIYI